LTTNPLPLQRVAIRDIVVGVLPLREVKTKTGLVFENNKTIKCKNPIGTQEIQLIHVQSGSRPGVVDRIKGALFRVEAC